MGGYGATPTERHFDRSIVILWAGPQAEDVLFVGGDPIERAAIHEAGHAVTSWRFARGIAEVAIRSDGSGITTTAPLGVNSAEALPLYALGETKDRYSEGPSRKAAKIPSDARRAVTIAKLLRADRKSARELVRVRRFEARLLITRNAELIRAVAAELLKAGRLSGLQVESIIAATVNEGRARRLKEIGT